MPVLIFAGEWIGREPSRRASSVIRGGKMSDAKAMAGRIRTEVYGHVLKIVIDNVAKKNSFSPQMMEQMSDALTLLDRTADYWVGVVCADGNDFTAGLDMPKFFGPTAEKLERKEGNIDVFALGN